MNTQNTSKFVFDVTTAAGCNGNTADDKAYIEWFCIEAVAKADRAADALRTIVDLRDWGAMETVRARLDASWALLVALHAHLGSLAEDSVYKKDISARYTAAQRDVEKRIKGLKGRVTAARGFFSADQASQSGQAAS